MPKLKGLIVDDVQINRDLLKQILNGDDEIEIVGEAANGQDAVEQVVSLHPDFVTMDLSMPVLDGLEAIGKIMKNTPVPIIVISEAGDDAQKAILALEQGALDVIARSQIQPENCEKLIRKLKNLAKVKVIRHIHMPSYRAEDVKVSKPEIDGGGKVVAIASSTGGPKALAKLLSDLPENISFPILIAQHIEHSFVSSLAEFFQKNCLLKIKVGEDQESLTPGTVYISRADRNMGIDSFKKITYRNSKSSDIYHPSCDFLLSTVGETFTSNSIGVILTGMGADGVEGIKKIKECGGTTLAQDEESSIIFGMPNEAAKSGKVDFVLSLDKIGPEILRLAQTES